MASGELSVTVPGVHGTDELYLRALRSIVGPGPEGRSLIDLCSYVARMTRQLGFGRRTFVDALPRDLGEDAPHFVCADVLGDHPAFERAYDVVTCMDGIEHLHKGDGELLVARMLELAPLRVLFTPLDPWMMEPEKPHPETHKSVWTPADLPGWASIVYPQYHPTLGIGAWFGWHRDSGLAADFERVRRELDLD